MMPCTEPPAEMIWSRSLRDQSLRACSSCCKCGLSTKNSPARVRRVYKLDVYGSKHSLLPRICAVEAVGIGATSNELRNPTLEILCFNVDQSQRVDGVTPHRSNWRSPLAAGEPTWLG